MFRLVRGAHFIMTAYLAAMILLYCGTGLLFVFFDAEQPTSTETATSNWRAGDAPGLHEAAIRIKDDFAIGGQLKRTRVLPDGRRRFDYEHPGTQTTAFLESDGTLTLTTVNQDSWIGALKHLHAFRVPNWTPFYFVWAVLFHFTALSFILLPFTGIYLWLKYSEARIGGTILLASGIAIGVLTTAALVFS